MRASRRELRSIDDVAAVARKLDVVLLLGRRGARLRELPGDAADLDHRLAAGVGQHDRHLQEDAEEIADIVGPVLGEALGAVAALEQEAAARGNARELLLQLARLACENQRRKRCKPRLDIVQRLGVRDSPAPAGSASSASFPATIYRLGARTPSSTPGSGYQSRRSARLSSPLNRRFSLGLIGDIDPPAPAALGRNCGP